MRILKAFIICLTIVFFVISNANAVSYDVDDMDFDAEDFKLSFLSNTEFVRGDNTNVTLKDFRGKVVVINFWGTWCPPCVAEMPEIDKMANDLKDDVHIIAIAESQDGKIPPSQLLADVKDFYKKHNIKHLEIYVDSFSQLFNMFETGTSLPATIVLDASGKERMRRFGILGWANASFREQILSYK